VLQAGVDALQAGSEALLAGLQWAHKSANTSLSVWVGPEGEGFALCDDDGVRRLSELPEELPGRWFEKPPLARTRFIGPDWLRRDPRARALEIDWALMACGEQEAPCIWMASQRPIEVTESQAQEMLRALASLAELDKRRALDGGRDRLVKMGERAASVAHDLRNQLSLTQLEFESTVLRQGVQLDGAQAALANALDLCRGFLTDVPTEGAEPEALAPHLEREIGETVRLSGRGGEVRVALRCAAQLRASFDPVLLHRYLRNLILNAIAATPRGGAVRISARAMEDDRVELTVSDEGRGMERADLERLLHAGESRGGTGFGTSSVLDCAQQMAADLDVESKQAAGTRFSLSLPSG
jgi:signal transduction histidine kinase